MIGKMKSIKIGVVKVLFTAFMLLLAAFASGQNTSIQVKDNLWGIDFHCLGTSVHYAHKIKGDLFLGAEIGILPDIFSRILLAGDNFTQDNTIWTDDKDGVSITDPAQLAFTHVFGRWKPKNEWFEMDIGLRRARFISSIPYEDFFGSPVFNGGYIKPSFGFNKFKIGIRLDFGNMSEKSVGADEFVIASSPFIRINFR